MKVTEFFKKSNLWKLKDLFRFIIVILIFTILGILWRDLFAYKIFGYEVFPITANFLAKILLLISDYLLIHVFSINSHIDPTTGFWFFPNNKSLELLRGCTGLKEMIMFTFIILFSRGPWKIKLIFIPSGLLILQFINIIRFVCFGLSLALYPGIFNFIHHYLFNLIFFTVIFFLWIWWVEYFSQRKADNIKA